MASMHHHIRYCLPFIRIACGDPGLPVLITLISHANVRNRAYPSYEGIAHLTRLSKPSIKKAIDGLINLNMVRVLENNERVNEEKALDSRLNIYELSGYMKLGELVIPYLYTDYAKLPVKITPLEDVQFEELVNDVYLYRLTTFTDMVNHVYSKKIYQEENIPLKEKTIVTPTGATVAVTPIEPPKPKPKRERKPRNTPKLLVNMTNQELNLVPPDELTPEQVETWGKQKPIWSLFEYFLVWNETEGWDNRTVEHYRDTAHPDDYVTLCKSIQDMGRWLQAFAVRPNTPTINPAFMTAFTDWYEETIVNTIPEQERKYPTTKQGFNKNLGKYLTWLSQLAKEPVR